MVKKVTALKPRNESISAYVRELIEKEHRARANPHHEAAARYQKFLQENPDERAAMEAWETAPLVNEIEPWKA